MLTAVPTQVGLRLACQHTAPAVTSRSFATAISRSPAASVRLSQARSKSTYSLSLNTRKSLQNTPRQKRHATTTASPILSHTDRPAAHSQALDWNTFFRLRTSRRYYSLTSSLIGLVSTTAGTFYFLTVYPDQSDYVVKLIPMDPIISTGIAMTAAMLTGWLLGPIFGNGLWRIMHRKGLAEFTSKERAFFERIKRHRVNPAGASTNNPVPDFYGEKIGSVQGYRRWLKDQRAFNRKRSGSFGGA
ncbi:Presequence translocated-associated motor subunit pam17, mitochondrial [Cyphellophora attinorum]|uniref:Presequence translocated-associated motor subunit PAM17 n=1 Tax=Cyphellophora attinorum TaxID=1664694 RepID=A0A0N0NRU4_9EURO|nr:Presequence translocated-associated motor subunit pam17, mitochondrial [Phialophora attinorum]KPI45498.1 Presequence translocated-associated motor subunit pam17, mitochondrial [Phialophora attinorum]